MSKIELISGAVYFSSSAEITEAEYTVFLVSKTTPVFVYSLNLGFTSHELSDFQFFNISFIKCVTG